METDYHPLPIGTYRNMLETFAADLPQEKIKLKMKVVKVQKHEEIVKIQVLNETN